MSQDQNQDRGFSPWDGNLNKLFETLQNTDGSSVEHYNHVISKILGSLASQNIQWINGVSYLTDPLRGKLLSLSRLNQSFNYYGPNQESRYLKIGDVVSSANGLIMTRNATITALTAQSRSTNNWSLQIRKNDQTTPLHTLNVNAGTGIADTLDIDVNAGDFIQLFINGSSIDHPLAFIELAWRQ